jgi:hypothetical protein
LQTHVAIVNIIIVVVIAIILVLRVIAGVSIFIMAVAVENNELHHYIISIIYDMHPYSKHHLQCTIAGVVAVQSDAGVEQKSEMGIYCEHVQQLLVHLMHGHSWHFH